MLDTKILQSAPKKKWFQRVFDFYNLIANKKYTLYSNLWIVKTSKVTHFSDYHLPVILQESCKHLGKQNIKVTALTTR